MKVKILTTNGRRILPLLSREAELGDGLQSWLLLERCRQRILQPKRKHPISLAQAISADYAGLGVPFREDS